MFQDEDGSSISPLKELLKGYNHCDLLRLAGRGIHLTVFSVWMLYILSSCVRVSSAMPPTMRRMMTWDWPPDTQPDVTDDCSEDELEPKSEQGIATIGATRSSSSSTTTTAVELAKSKWLPQASSVPAPAPP